MENLANIYYQTHHVPPYRFYLKDSENYYGLIDLQIKPELRNLDNPTLQEHSLSVYLKPPINVNYQLYSKDYTLKSSGAGQVEFELQTLTNSEYRNPYISWHGSGEIHANAYKHNMGQRTFRIADNQPALTWRDVIARYSLILRAVIPLTDNSHLQVTPNLVNSLDFSNQPAGRVKNSSPDAIILDKKVMQSNMVTVDIFIHNRGYRLRDINELPYPSGADLVWLGPPLTFENNDSVFVPAVSVLAYQSTHNSEVRESANPMILNGISKTHPVDDIYIQSILLNS